MEQPGFVVKVVKRLRQVLQFSGITGFKCIGILLAHESVAENLQVPAERDVWSR